MSETPDPTAAKPKRVRTTYPPLSENENIKILPGWINLTEAGRILGVSRQYAYLRAQMGDFRTLHRIGGNDTKTKVFVVALKEIEKIAAREQAEAEAAEAEETTSA